MTKSGRAVFRTVPLPDHEWPIEGAVIEVGIRRVRNRGFQNLYWAMLTDVVRQTDSRWGNVGELHKWIKAQLGYYKEAPIGDDLVVIEWTSTRIASMAEGTFKTYVQKAGAVIALETGIDIFALDRRLP